MICLLQRDAECMGSTVQAFNSIQMIHHLEKKDKYLQI